MKNTHLKLTHPASRPAKLEDWAELRDPSRLWELRFSTIDPATGLQTHGSLGLLKYFYTLPHSDPARRALAFASSLNFRSHQPYVSFPASTPIFGWLDDGSALITFGPNHWVIRPAEALEPIR